MENEVIIRYSLYTKSGRMIQGQGGVGDCRAVSMPVVLVPLFVFCCPFSHPGNGLRGTAAVLCSKMLNLSSFSVSFCLATPTK
jgi:hypothetical protein